MYDKKQDLKFKYIILFSFLFFSLSSIKLFSQVKFTNLEVFYKLTDSAASNLAQRIPSSHKNLNLNLVLGNSYNIFGNKIINSLTREGRNILGENIKDSSSTIINFTIDNAKVTYGNLFRKSIFGDFHTTRNLILSGSYVLYYKDAKSYNFKYSYSDTVSVSDIKNIENPSYPFTQSKLPAEPIISSIYEPVIAVGVAALTVILFFTVRSK